MPADMRRGGKWLGGLAILAVVLVLLLLSRSCDDCGDTAAPTPEATVTSTVTATPTPVGSQVGVSLDLALTRVKQTGWRTGAHDASEQDDKPDGDWTVCFEEVTLSEVEFAAVSPGAPCPKKDGKPIPWPRMPDVRGLTYDDAVTTLGTDAGSVFLEAAYQDEDADDENNLSGDYTDWTVCFQSVESGRKLKHAPQVTLHAVAAGESCPRAKGLYKDPTNDPDYVAPDPDPVDAPDPDPGAGSSDEGSGDGGGSDREDYYPGDKGGCPPGGCYNPCPPGGCR
ncbi:hypothetical protein G3I20_33805 [Streptomyces sp. SID8111]|uniref:PASTA domain-containing protein n=1 Tax=Streptomyces sp. SID8111 TaxID=2706100 RepID=UPI0013BFB932|nr:PASTA domain-containing protein [Streptomyces sp. SID8111]NEC31446.1 hypothetical protein [Streptomyces sp. SID8111]